jgi:hypothetical protein
VLRQLLLHGDSIIREDVLLNAPQVSSVIKKTVNAAMNTNVQKATTVMKPLTPAWPTQNANKKTDSFTPKKC